MIDITTNDTGQHCNMQNIGYQAESLRTRVRISLEDFSDIISEYPDGTYTLAYKREGDKCFFVSENFEVDGDALIWTVESAALAVKGVVEVQVAYASGSIVSETRIYKYRVRKSLFSAHEAPKTFIDLLSSALTALNEAIERAHIDLSGKADKTDTVLYTTLSRGRAEGSTVGEGSIAFGAGTTASGNNSRAIGAGTQATGFASSAEGSGSRANGANSHSEGAGTEASGDQAHSEGSGTKATNHQAHSEGNNTLASGNSSHSEGAGTTASGNHAHSEGSGTVASADYSHSEGLGTKAQGRGSHAEGQGTETAGTAAHTEGVGSKASGEASHSEGGGSKATGSYSHAEGGGTTASGSSAHSEGGGTVASAFNSHAEGAYTIANSDNMHSQGVYNKPNDPNTFRVIRQWHSGNNYKIGNIVHTNGRVYVCKIPNSDTFFTQGKWFCLSDGEKAFSIGNGFGDDNRHDAFAVLWDGTLVLDEEAYLTKEDVVDLHKQNLRDEYIPDTTQTYTFDSDDFVIRIDHNRDGDTIRTDSFEYGDESITETRILNATGERLTIVTDLTTYAKSVTYATAS